MKQLLSARILALLAFCAIFAQCNVQSVTINTLKPAKITFPSYVNTLVLVDRTTYARRGDEVIHDLFSGGIPGEDRGAVQSAIASLNSNLQLSPRFKVLVATEEFKGNSLTTSFPDAMPWEEIQSICDEYKCEGVVAFEMFGSNFSINKEERKVQVQQKQSDGKYVNVDGIEHWVHGTARVRMGIRLYEPKAKTIIDQQLFTQSHTWDAKGNNFRDAEANLISSSEATRFVADNAAKSYAYKIAPMPIKLSRQFYTSSKKVPAMEQGSKLSNVNDWNGAVTTWQNALTDATPKKDAGQLCIDIAVGYEVQGNLELAKKWADRAYVDYNNKNGKYYSQTLANRMADEQKVDEQMK